MSDTEYNSSACNTSTLHTASQLYRNDLTYQPDQFIDLTSSELDELTCSICLNIVDKPYALNCEHLFCSSCIDQLNSRLCPLCNMPITYNDTRQYNKFVISKIYRSRYKCTVCNYILNSIGIDNRNLIQHEMTHLSFIARPLLAFAKWIDDTMASATANYKYTLNRR